MGRRHQASTKIQSAFRGHAARSRGPGMQEQEGALHGLPTSVPTEVLPVFDTAPADAPTPQASLTAVQTPFGERGIGEEVAAGDGQLLDRATHMASTATEQGEVQVEGPLESLLWDDDPPPRPGSGHGSLEAEGGEELDEEEEEDHHGDDEYSTHFETEMSTPPAGAGDEWF